MMGKFAIFAIAMLAALQASAQYYKVSIKAVGDKNLNFPVADFMLEEGSAQLKGFEARINAAGFGADGFKPSRLLEQEIKAKFEKELKKELDRKPEERLEEALEILESRMANAESVLADDDSSKKRGGKSGETNYSKLSDAEKKAMGAALRRKMAAEKSRSEYQEFKDKVEKAKRNRALMKELVDELDKKAAETLKYRMLRESIHQSGYPFGTYYNISLKKVAANQAVIDFESAVSFMTGWMPGEGNNNNNSINSSLNMEYVDMPKLEDISVELGKPYCFQIARPVDKGGSLDEALDGTSIFARSLDPKKIAPMHRVVVENFTSNPLNRNGLLAEIQKNFKGREREVVRVILTITKQ